MEFKEWLLINEDAGSPGAKQALYPMGYGGIGLYPPSDVITWGADAMTYMPEKIRQLKFVWGKGMLKNPFEKNSLYQSMEGKTAKQIQAGNLKVGSDTFKQYPNYSETIPLHTIQAGSLTVDGKSFEKTDYIQKSPNGGIWDYKQIGQRAGKPILPIISI